MKSTMGRSGEDCNAFEAVVSTLHECLTAAGTVAHQIMSVSQSAVPQSAVSQSAMSQSAVSQSGSTYDRMRVALALGLRAMHHALEVASLYRLKMAKAKTEIRTTPMAVAEIQSCLLGLAQVSIGMLKMVVGTGLESSNPCRASAVSAIPPVVAGVLHTALVCGASNVAFHDMVECEESKLPMAVCLAVGLTQVMASMTAKEALIASQQLSKLWDFLSSRVEDRRAASRTTRLVVLRALPALLTLHEHLGGDGSGDSRGIWEAVKKVVRGWSWPFFEATANDNDGQALMQRLLLEAMPEQREGLREFHSSFMARHKYAGEI
eukprot:Polyplicarium_translucidae@DN1290_c0_g1_i1.p1